MKSSRLVALGLLVFGLWGCRDPGAGPPPRRLTAGQSTRLAEHLLKAPPSPAFPASATLGKGRLRFLGSDVHPPTPARGRPVRLTHYFEVLAPLEGSYKIFVHVRAPGSQGMLVNADHQPVDGLHPTDRWVKGQIVEDAYTFTVPSDAPDEIEVLVGFFRFDERLPVDDPFAQDGANRIVALRLKVAGRGADLPVYTAPRRKGAIAIDGDLGDEGWKAVPSTGPFVRTIDGATPHSRTEARLTWDDEALYVAFDCEDEDVWAKLEKDDDPIYGEEVVEVFLDADGDGKTYNELEVSPRNVHFDAFFPARRQGMDLAWNSGMTTAVRVRGTLNDPGDRDEGWAVEMKVPVARLAAVPRWPPGPGDRWRFNLYRLEWHSGRKVNEGSAFSPPLVGDFHNLPRFGVLAFGP